MSLSAQELDAFLELLQRVSKLYPLRYLAKSLWWSSAGSSLELPSPCLAFRQALSSWEYMGSHLHYSLWGKKRGHPGALRCQGGARFWSVTRDGRVGALSTELSPGSRCWDSGGGVLWWPSEVLSPLRVFETQGGHPAKFWGELLIRRQLCQTAKCQKDFYSSFLLFTYLFSLSWSQILGWQEVESFSL